MIRTTQNIRIIATMKKGTVTLCFVFSSGKAIKTWHQKRIPRMLLNYCTEWEILVVQNAVVRTGKASPVKETESHN